MNKNDIKQLGVYMAVLSEEFTDGKPISELKIQTWYNALEKYEIKVIGKAVSNIAQKRIYNGFPKLAEIINEIEGSADDRALLAWNELKEAIARVGAYNSVKFSDPKTVAVVNEMGGWAKVCEVKEDDLKWMQKDFERLYKVCQPAKNLLLPGIIEITNNLNGYKEHIPQPVLIGEYKEINQITGN